MIRITRNERVEKTYSYSLDVDEQLLKEVQEYLDRHIIGEAPIVTIDLLNNWAECNFGRIYDDKYDEILATVYTTRPFPHADWTCEDSLDSLIDDIVCEILLETDPIDNNDDDCYDARHYLEYVED